MFYQSPVMMMPMPQQMPMQTRQQISMVYTQPGFLTNSMPVVLQNLKVVISMKSVSAVKMSYRFTGLNAAFLDFGCALQKFQKVHNHLLLNILGLFTRKSAIGRLINSPFYTGYHRGHFFKNKK